MSKPRFARFAGEIAWWALRVKAAEGQSNQDVDPS